MPEQEEPIQGRHYGITPEFPLPDKTRPGRVDLQISDLARSIDYYVQVLGLALLDKTRDCARLGTPGTDRCLVALHGRHGIRRVRPSGRFGLYHFAILLPDRKALARFTAHVVRLRIPMGAADHLVSEALYLKDPDGLGIEVYADRPRENWKIRQNELVMTTDPLDVEGLIGAGGDRAWDRTPDNTVIGHLHLHVGDLEQAEEFYHTTLGFNKTVWSYPGALFFSAGGYHHHLGTNIWSPGPSAAEDEARLLKWELILPSEDARLAVHSRLQAAGYSPEDQSGEWTVADPWGTRLQLSAAHP
ncbi:MAG TPA: VOC family protein [Acidobacteriota bacterium]|nr:VOC family protein [Acidobacteriota bacterium]